MSYSALSHGGVARVSTLIVDAQLDTGAFGIKADRIEESTPAAGVDMVDGIKTGNISESVPGGSVDYDNPLKLKANSFVPVASDRVRVSSPAVVDSNTTHIVVCNGTVPAYYVPGTVRVGGELELTSTYPAHTLYFFVYVNSVLKETVSRANVVGAGYVSVSADIAVTAGDVIRAEFSVTTSATGTCKNVFIGCDDIDTPPILTRNAVWP